MLVLRVVKCKDNAADTCSDIKFDALPFMDCSGISQYCYNL